MRRRSAFASPAAPNTDANVRRVVEAYWKAIVQAFEAAGFDEPAEVKRIDVSAKWHDTCRHYAAARTDGRVLGVAPQIIDLGDAHIIALLAHEGGHFVDFGRPGRYFFRQPRDVRVRRGAKVSVFEGSINSREQALFQFETLPAKLGKHLTEWRERSDDEKERVADAIAVFVMGESVGYTGSPGCLVQIMGEGVERPEGLR